MEGLIPFIYGTMTRYKKGKAAPSAGSMFLNEFPPPASYAQLTNSESSKYLMSDSHSLFPSSPRTLMALPAAGAPESPRWLTSVTANPSAPPQSQRMWAQMSAGQPRHHHPPSRLG